MVDHTSDGNICSLCSGTSSLEVEGALFHEISARVVGPSHNHDRPDVLSRTYSRVQVLGVR
jgi:hypothetical protein